MNWEHFNEKNGTKQIRFIAIRVALKIDQILDDIEKY